MSETEQKKSKSLIYIILLILALIVAGIAGYLYFQKSDEVKSLVAEKEQIRSDLQNELDELMEEHNEIKTEYGYLSDTLASRDSLIQANAKEIKGLLNYKWEYYQIKKKLDRLRVTAQTYVRQMDSLYTVNHELTEENARIRESFRSEQMKNSELKTEKMELEEIVESASTLRAYNIQATGIRQRGSNQKETDKARRTDRVRVCFTLGENMLVEHGMKNIYIRISRPDDVVLMIDESDKYAFDYQGAKLQYSIKREVNYTGEPIDICAFWNKGNKDDEAMEGTYHVHLFMDKEKIGESAFDLR
jgi:predicted nuclease with TOPRIM domain